MRGIEFNSTEEEFGEERLYSILTDSKNLPIKTSIENALSSLDLILNGIEKQDDITVIGIGYK